MKDEGKKVRIMEHPGYHDLAIFHMANGHAAAAARDGKAKKHRDMAAKLAGEVVADALVLGTLAVEPIPLECFEEALGQVKSRASQHDAIGPMFNPTGYEAQDEFYRQGIDKLKALVMFRKAIVALNESRAKEGERAAGRAKLASILGPF